jgi:hypothetical protein
MSAADIAHALGDARREGRTWRCRCPLHDGRSFTLMVMAGRCSLGASAVATVAMCSRNFDPAGIAGDDETEAWPGTRIKRKTFPAPFQFPDNPP